VELGKPFTIQATGCGRSSDGEQTGTQSKKKQPTKQALDEQLVKSMQHRMENVTGINKFLQQTILKKHKPDEEV